MKLGGLEGSKTSGDGDWLGADGSVEGPSFKWDWWEKTFGTDPSDGRDPKYKDREESPFKISLGKAEGSAYVARPRASGRTTGAR